MPSLATSWIQLEVTDQLFEGESGVDKLGQRPQVIKRVSTYIKRGMVGRWVAILHEYIFTLYISIVSLQIHTYNTPFEARCRVDKMNLS